MWILPILLGPCGPECRLPSTLKMKKTSFPLSRDDLEKYLRSLDNAALKSFLQRSKI